MKELISNDTGRPPNNYLHTDVDILPDGEGGIYLTMCWHELLELGSVAAHLPSHKVKDLIHNIRIAMGDRDLPQKRVEKPEPLPGWHDAVDKLQKRVEELERREPCPWQSD